MKIQVLILLLVLPAGCRDDRLDVYKTPPLYLPTVDLNDSLAYVSETFEEAKFVTWDDGAAEPMVTTIPVGRKPVTAVSSRDRDRLFVICHGAAEGEVRQSEVEEESLHLIDPGAGESSVYVIGSPFTALAESESGRYAVLFFDRDVAGTNPNLFAVVDTTEPPSETNPEVRSIRTLGSIPLAVIVAEDIAVAGGAGVQEKDFALILSRSYITLFDLENLSREEITVPLVIPEAGIDVIPIEEDVIISSDPAGMNSRIILRSDNSSDIFSITFVGLDPGGPLENDYRVSLNQLSVDVNPHDAPSDMEMFLDEGRQLVLVTTVTSDSFAVVDPETTMVTTISVEYDIENSMVFDRGRSAVLYTMGQRMGYFVDLRDIEDDRERGLREFPFGGRLSSFVRVPQKDYVVMMLQEEPRKLFILDLVGQQMDLVNLYDSSLSTQFLMYPDGNHIMMSAHGKEEVWFIEDMSSFQIERIILDYPVYDVHMLDASSGSGKVVLDHDAGEGFLTFLDMNEPKRSTAVSIRGFLLQGVMNLTPDDYTIGGG